MPIHTTEKGVYIYIQGQKGKWGIKRHEFRS